jgi:hypothetical protein
MNHKKNIKFLSVFLLLVFSLLFISSIAFADTGEENPGEQPAAPDNNVDLPPSDNENPIDPPENEMNENVVPNEPQEETLLKSVPLVEDESAGKPGVSGESDPPELALASSQNDFSTMGASGQAGTTLTAVANAEGHWEIIYAWEIEKTVDPTQLDLYVGDSSLVNYTVNLTKDSGTEKAYVDGYVDVTNGGDRPTENLLVQAILQAKSNITSGGWVDVPGATDYPDMSLNPVLDPGESGAYYYYITIPVEFYPYFAGGLEFRINSIVTITNHSGHLGEPFGPSPDASVTMPTTPKKINDSINVDDTNGMTWEFNNSGTVSYSKTIVCEESGEFTKSNTATIRETGKSSSAVVTVKCTEVAGNTFTIGFWKNHSGLGNGNQADLISKNLPISLGSLQVTTVSQAVEILSGMSSNGISKLYAQLLAAKLNIANGASSSTINTYINQADSFLMGKTAASWSTLSKADQKKVLGWMEKFDQYNNGL